MNPSIPPRKTIFPECITARLVQSDSTSERMCEDMIIVPPSLTNSLKSERNCTTPAGSMPIMGSSRMRTLGAPIIDWATLSLWTIPLLSLAIL